MTSLRVGCLGVCLLGCGTLLGLDSDPDEEPTDSGLRGDASVRGGEEGESGSNGQSSSGTIASSSSSSGSSSDAGGLPLWADVQLSLAQLRQQGPLSAAQSQGQCTDHYFVWKETDGTLHSWFADDGTVIDYAFKAPARPFFRASDRYLVVDTQPYSQHVDVYRTAAANDKVTQLALPAAWSAVDDGVLLVQAVSSSSVRVSKWKEGQAITLLTASDLTSQQPPAAYENGQLLLPAGVTQPFPLYLVNAATGAVDSVNFAGAAAFRAGEPSARGLFVSYARQGGINALRWYKNDQDDTVELTDALALISPFVADPPIREHEFIVHAAYGGGSTLFYGGFYGIWAYDLDAGTVKPVQLSVNKATFTPDILCVIRGAHKLVYRNGQDATGRIYWIDIAQIP